MNHACTTYDDRAVVWHFEIQKVACHTALFLSYIFLLSLVYVGEGSSM